MLRNQKGFTLIEIIAVLVILGILAAIAIPKFLDLQNDARLASARGAVAAAQSAISNGFAQWLLNSGGPSIPAGPTAACANVILDPPGSYTLNCSGTSWSAVITSNIDVTFQGQTATGTWTKP